MSLLLGFQRPEVAEEPGQHPGCGRGRRGCAVGGAVAMTPCDVAGPDPSATRGGNIFPPPELLPTQCSRTSDFCSKRTDR